MKKPDQKPKDNDEIENIDQFQMQRSGGNAAEDHPSNEDNDDEGYTEGEIPFADGKGTQLDELIDEEEQNDED